MEVCDIIHKLNSSNFFLKETKHNVTRNIQRNQKFEMIYNLLFSAEIVGVIKQNFNKFLIYYEHPFKESKDVCIVIGIDEFKCVNIITNFTKNKDLRVRV